MYEKLKDSWKDDGKKEDNKKKEEFYILYKTI